MKVKGQLTWQDYLDASLLHSRPAGLTRLVLLWVAFCLVVVLVVGIFLVFQGTFPFALLLPALTIATFFLLWRFVLLPRKVRHLFSQQADLRAPFEIDITEISVRFSNEFGQTDRPWDHFVNWKENARLFTIYHSDLMYSILPKRLFDGEQEIGLVRRTLSQAIALPRRRRSLVGGVVLIILFLVVLTLVIQFRAPTP